MNPIQKNRRIVPCAVLLAGAFLAGCASGPKYSEISNSIPPIPAADGRIYFFRSSSMMGAALQPDIRLNGQVVGTSKAGGFFYVDEPAGAYTAATSTDSEKAATFTLGVGETRYLRTSPSFGLLVGSIVIGIEDPQKAKTEIQTLSLTGRSKANSAVPSQAPDAQATEAQTGHAVPGAPAGPQTVASVMAAAQMQAQSDVVRHIEARTVDGTEWVFPSWNTQTFRDVHMVFRGGHVQASNQRDHTSGTYTVAGDKVCLDLRSNAWGKSCYVVIEAVAGQNAHGLQVMEVPSGNRLPLTIR